MKSIYCSGLLILTLFSLWGCANTVPLISHAHVGHALTSWHDTPDQIGLYVSARNEADEALAIATEMLEEQNPAQLEEGIKQIGYLLNPDVAAPIDHADGPRYGIIRALEGVLDHIEFAASSEDASLNLVTSVNDLSRNGEQVLNNFIYIFHQTQQSPSTENLEAHAKELYEGLFYAINGQRQGEQVSVYGMVDFTEDFNAMLARESDPRYEPLPRKYVLGLVRLPNGHWGYKLKAEREPTEIVDY